MRERGCIALALFVTVAVTTRGAAQQPGPDVAPVAWLCGVDATAGSPVERSILIANLLGGSASTVLRPLLREEIDSIVSRRWKGRDDSSTTECTRLLRHAAVSAWYNTSTSRVDQDGAVWQGRGVTVSLTTGAVMALGAVELAIRPLFYASENRAFVPRPSTNALDFRHPIWPDGIDAPYRFGDDAFGAANMGESYVRLRWRRTAVGVTTETQQWGPANRYPLLIGTQASGYPRAFIETRSLPIGIGALTVHWQLGFLESSGFSNLPRGGRSRITTSALGSFRPRGMDGLEIGGGRFFHIRRTPGVVTLANATLPFSGLLKSQSRDDVVGGYNQLASVFFRLAPPRTGFEVFGEFLREDHNANLRDLVGEPDHASAYTLGLRRATDNAGVTTWFTLEYANGRLSHLNRVRPQGIVYTHSAIREGHTYEGQTLGTSAMIGGGGATFSWGRIRDHRSSGIAYEYRRAAQHSEGRVWNGSLTGSHILRYDWNGTGNSIRYGLSTEAEAGGGHARSNFSLMLRIQP